MFLHFQNENPEGAINNSAKDIVKGIQETKTGDEKAKKSRVDGRRMTIMENVAAKQKKAEFTNLEKEFKKKFQNLSKLTRLLWTSLKWHPWCQIRPQSNGQMRSNSRIRIHVKLNFFTPFLAPFDRSWMLLKVIKIIFLEVNGLLGKGRRDQGMVRLG